MKQHNNLLQPLPHLFYGQVTTADNRTNKLVTEHFRLIEERGNTDCAGRFRHHPSMTVQQTHSLDDRVFAHQNRVIYQAAHIVEVYAIA